MPRPYRAKAAVYNSAGELVRILYEGDSSSLPDSLPLDRSAFVAGADLVTALLPDSFSGAGAITWDGSNSLGTPVGGGVYTVKMELIDPFGLVTSLSTAVTVLADPDRARLTLSNSAGELVWQHSVPKGFCSFRLDAAELVLPGEGQDLSGNAGLQIRLRDNAGTLVPIAWNGRTANGELARGGIYILQLSVESGYVKPMIQSASVVVLRGPDRLSLESAFLAPNPASKEQWVTLYCTPIAGRTAFACLYSLAGEKVSARVDLPASGELKWDTHGLASGVYQCIVQQGSQKRALKLAVLR